MRVLVISRTAWRKDNSFGNTYSNIFGGMENVEIANLYLGEGLPDPDNDNVISYYQISEREAAYSLLNRKKVGKVLTEDKLESFGDEQSMDAYGKSFAEAKRIRLPLFFIVREIIWKIARVNYTSLMSYIQDFNPDIIFLSFYYAAYVDRLALQIMKKMHIPMVLEAAIDIYSLKQISMDPLYWINRFYIRHMIKKTVRVSEKLYVISEKMKTDYERMLRIPCGVLYKFPDRTRCRCDYRPSNKPYVFLFTGNISSNRWKTLAVLGTLVKEKKIGIVKIYTATPLTKYIKKRLKDCIVHPAISPEEVVLEQNKADVLLHVESFQVKNKLEVRYSISTKIMDYLCVGRSILAISPRNIASTEFLRDNDLAIICDDPKKISDILNMIEMNPQLLPTYANRTKTYIESAISREEMQRLLYDDMQRIIDQHGRNA